MGKISPVSAKYIINASIQIEGVVDRPDIIGAVFGQTEGLLGADLELRELQRSGRIGRIEVNTDVKSGKTQGTITVPSSLDKAETAIVAAAIETIERIGPCNAKVRIDKLEDVRIAKRNHMITRAKELLKTLSQDILPDSQEITEAVSAAVRMQNITEYGRERLPAGPQVADGEEIIIVEGRADVLNLLKYGFKNAVALNGTSMPPSIVDLCKEKVVTLFVDGDRGGDLIIREVTGAAEIDFVAKAPDGKEVEEITSKEIHKALRGKVAAEQAKMDIKELPKRSEVVRKVRQAQNGYQKKPYQKNYRTPTREPVKRVVPLTATQKTKFRELLDDLIGTRGAYILDDNMDVLGKVPFAELVPTIKNLNAKVFAVVFDGTMNSKLIPYLEKAGVKYIISMDSEVKSTEVNATVLTPKNL